MAHVPGSADEIRARVPAVLESYAFIRDNVLLDGPADRELKQLCFRFLAGEIEPSGYEGRERAALDWAHAIAWDSDKLRRRALGAAPRALQRGGARRPRVRDRLRDGPAALRADARRDARAASRFSLTE